MPSDADKIRVADLLEELAPGCWVVALDQSEGRWTALRASSTGVSRGHGPTLLSCLEQAAAAKEER